MVIIVKIGIILSQASPTIFITNREEGAEHRWGWVGV